jgi:hypothetical protein
MSGYPDRAAVSLEVAAPAAAEVAAAEAAGRSRHRPTGRRYRGAFQVVVEHQVNLLPLAELIASVWRDRARVRAQIEDVLGRDPRLRQPISGGGRVDPLGP